MAYSEHIVQKAKKEISRRRQYAQQQAEGRKAELVSVCPQLEQIDTELSKAGLQAVKAIGMGASAVEYIEKLAEKNLFC
ncbi:MAG: hypothetical protein LBH71_01210 [Oscillospiraceae bacterium]|jgi:hypothetical protein|nr:hypothetical protein [Oscillospiraceae bacterium]